MLFPAALLLVALAGQQPEPGEGQDNTDLIVQGQRYDYSVELSERLDKLAATTQEALGRREAFRGEMARRLDRLATLGGIAQQARERLADLDRRLAGLDRPHPVCTYAIDRSGAEGLSPAGLAALDVLARLGPSEASSTLLEACRQALPDDADARVACEWVVIGAAHAVCTQNPSMAPVCPKLDGVDPADIPAEGGLDLAVLFLARQLKRFGDKVDCGRARDPWLQQACRALAAGDARACPLWSLRRQQDLRGILVDPARALAPIDFAVFTFFDRETRELLVFHDGRFQLSCRQGGGGDAPAEVLLQPSPHPLSLARLPASIVAPDAEAPAAVCRATAAERPAENGKAPR